MSIIHDALKKTQMHLRSHHDGPGPENSGKESRSGDSGKPGDFPDPEPVDVSKIYEKLYREPAEKSDSPAPAPDKSAERPQEKSAGQPAEKETLPRVSAPLPFKEKRKRYYRNLILLLAGCLILSGILISLKGWLESSGLSTPETPVASFSKSPAPSATGEPRQRGESTPSPFAALTKPFTTIPSRSQTSDPSTGLVLNGTMMMGDRRVALINNKIYEPGDVVQEKRILNITLEEVTLEDSDGKIVTLKTKKP